MDAREVSEENYPVGQFHVVNLLVRLSWHSKYPNQYHSNILCICNKNEFGIKKLLQNKLIDKSGDIDQSCK